MNKERLNIKAGAVIITLIAAVILMMPIVAMAGDLQPPSGPDNATSAMYTLDDIYNYLETGVEGTKRTGGFTEPTADSGSTGNSLDEIHEKIKEKCFETCEGTLNGTRWCDQGDGTVKDMTTGLVWLKNANCFGQKRWIDTSTWDDAQTSSGTLKSGSCGLTDGSVEGDWRLPTKVELVGLSNGTEAARSGSMRAFTGVQSGLYWLSTTYAPEPHLAWHVYMANGSLGGTIKGASYYVWPVRSEN